MGTLWQLRLEIVPSSDKGLYKYCEGKRQENRNNPLSQPDFAHIDSQRLHCLELCLSDEDHGNPLPTE